MAFEKAKVLKAAEKYLSQGKIDAAIKEYRQIVEHDDQDLTTLNMLGDLCARAGHHDQAISCFSKIAEHYREQEFTLKAIAMYKKIERLKPRDPAIASKLAVLYANQGLTADARAQYLIVADALTHAGNTKQTLEVLHRVADLDPHNTEIRVKLAEGYLKESLPSEAANAFREAATRLFDAGQFEKALDAYSRVLELRPNDEISLKGVVSAHVALGSADEAAELLEKMVEERSDDPQLVAMLARTYIAAEDAAGAERATAALLAQDPSNYTRFIEVAQLYLKRGDVDDATRILGDIIEQLLAGREENDLLELVNEVLARNPEHVAALRLLVRIHWWQRDMDNLRLALERLAEAAEGAGLHSDERYALTQLVRLAPEEQRYSDRLKDLGGVQEEELDEAPLPLEPSFTDVPSFEAFGKVDHDTATMTGPGSDQSSEFEQFEWNAVAEQQAPADPHASFADLNEDSAIGSSPGVNSNTPQVGEFEFSGVALEETSTEHLETALPTGAAARSEDLIRQELESVDFYIAQGYVDIATDTLDLMEKQFGKHPEIDSRREQLKAGTKVQEERSEASSPFEFVGTEQLLGEEKSEAIPAPAGDGQKIDTGLAEIFEEFRLAAEEEPSTKEDYETHYNMGTAYMEMDLFDESIQEFQVAAGLSKPGDGTSRYLQCCNMLGHCFLKQGMPRAAVIWFKKGLDSEGHHEDEYKALRYELGLAYEQMGDLKRAVDEFTEVYGADVSYRGVAEKLRELQPKMKVKKRRKSN